MEEVVNHYYPLNNIFNPVLIKSLYIVVSRMFIIFKTIPANLTVVEENYLGFNYGIL